FRGRLAVAAGDADDQRLDAREHQPGDVVQRLPRVWNDDLDDACRRLEATLDHDGGGAADDRVLHELMAVHLRAAQGEENAAGLHLARVGVVRGVPLTDLGAADFATAGRLEQVEECQLHVLSRTASAGLELSASPRRSAGRSSATPARR